MDPVACQEIVDHPVSLHRYLTGNGDLRQRFVKLLAICPTLGRRALSQVVKIASHTRHLTRMG